MQSDIPKYLTLKNGDTLRYGEYGSPNGHPTLFFHGWPGSRLEGAFIGDAATKSGLRIIAPDRFTAHQIGINDYYRAWADIMDELLFSLKIKHIDIIAVSGGAPHAYALMHYHPAYIQRVTIVCGMVPLLESYKLTPLFKLGRWAQCHAPSLINKSLQFLHNRLSQSPQSMLKLLRFFTAGKDRETLSKKTIQEFIITNVLNATREGIDALSREISFMLYGWDFEPLLHQQKIHVWHGDCDRVIPLIYVEDFLKNYAYIDFHLMKNEGHYSIAMENTYEILQAHTTHKPE